MLKAISDRYKEALQATNSNLDLVGVEGHEWPIQTGFTGYIQQPWPCQYNVEGHKWPIQTYFTGHIKQPWPCQYSVQGHEWPIQTDFTGHIKQPWPCQYSVQGHEWPIQTDFTGYIQQPWPCQYNVEGHEWPIQTGFTGHIQEYQILDILQIYPQLDLMPWSHWIMKWMSQDLYLSGQQSDWCPITCTKLVSIGTPISLKEQTNKQMCLWSTNANGDNKVQIATFSIKFTVRVIISLTLVSF